MFILIINCIIKIRSEIIIHGLRVPPGTNPDKPRPLRMKPDIGGSAFANRKYRFLKKQLIIVILTIRLESSATSSGSSTRRENIFCSTSV